MSTQTVVLLLFSLLGLTTISVLHLARSKNLTGFLLQVSLVVGYSLLIYLQFFSRELLTAKGDERGELAFLMFLYLAIVLGMLAHHGYFRFSLPKRRRKKMDYGQLLAPVFLSPIVLLPLMSSLSDRELDIHALTKAKIMLLLLAFQNGFCWQDFFANRKTEKEAENVSKEL